MSDWVAVTRAMVLGAVLAVAGCTSQDPYTGEEKVSKTTKGAGIGAAAGAVLGAAVSDDDRGKGAAIGAAVGAGIGGGVGNYMDRQEAVLREQLRGTGVRVQRVGDTIKLIMPGNITFDVDSARVQSDFEPVLDSVLAVVKEYNKTILDIKGYTDSTGSFEYNQQLSERRADSVARYFLNNGVVAGRIRTTGYGPRHPIASNETPEGRSQNRRVEIDLLPMK